MVVPASLMMTNQKRRNDMFDLPKVIAMLERSHSAYSILVQSIDVKTNGWLISFTVLPKEISSLGTKIYERVAFLERQDATLPAIKWDSIC